MISKKVFLQNIELLMAAFNYTLPDKSVEVYYNQLKDECDDAKFERVVKDIIRHNKKFPLIADFVSDFTPPWFGR